MCLSAGRGANNGYWPPASLADLQPFVEDPDPYENSMVSWMFDRLVDLLHIDPDPALTKISGIGYV